MSSITTFSAFRSRNYRLFFVGQSISLFGTWMQKTAVSWIVYALTGSKFMLGVSLFASMFPSFLLSFMGGVAADRFNRYRLLLVTQVASMVQAVIMCLLVTLGTYTVWEVLGLSVVLGCINAFDVPARQSLVYEMVADKKDLPNALALNSSMVNLSRLLGPAAAGLIIERWGERVCFGLNALSFVAVITSLLFMRLTPFIPRKQGGGVFLALRDGLSYIRNTPSIAFVLGMLGMMSLFVLPFITLIPVYARDIFHGTAATFGVIDSAIGLGAFAGAIFLASLKPGTDLRSVLAKNTFVFGAGLVLFAYMPNYYVSLACATIAAFGMMSQITITNTLVQMTVAPEMRGRVISFYAMSVFGMQPLGGLVVGAMSQQVGVEHTVFAEGCIAIFAGTLHVWFNSKRKKKGI